MGCLVTRNFSAGEFEGADMINGARLVELMAERPNAEAKHRCMAGCVINCSQVFTDEDGNEVTSGFEFESLGLLGSNCAITDLDQLARIDRLCDDLGLDTIEIGAAVGVAMEGGLLPWGDGVAVHELLGKLTVRRRERQADRQRLRRDRRRRSESSAYPPSKDRGSPPGSRACSRAPGSPTRPALRAGTTRRATLCPAPPTLATTQARPEGQAQMSQFLQAYFAAIDALGMCLFACLPPLDMPELQGHLLSAVAALTGKELPEGYLIDLWAARSSSRSATSTAAPASPRPTTGCRPSW